MRDLVVREGLQTMARDAAKLFRELIAGGEEIPYEVREPGNGSPLCEYEPLTERFVRDHAGALRELDSFGAACAALEAADLSGPYLDRLGVPAPPDARARAELTGVVFLCRLWLGSSDFSLDRERLVAAIEELEAGAEAADDEIDVVVPLRGLQMPVARLELATATIVRADTVDVPAEARAGDVIGASPWEPTFLAIARIVPAEDGGEADAAAADARAGTDAFRRLITTLRLFKGGGVGLGPHAWVASAAGRWRRISTGAGKPRPGGYRLAEGDLGDLVAFSRALASPDTPFGRTDGGPRTPARGLARAISRFEAGLERPVVVEALSDNLLALRFVLEGGGPADLSLPMRVAALCAEPDRRAAVKAVIERAGALERELWSGEPQGGGPIPAETAGELEELTRAILKDAACGHLGGDLRTTADEILLADGLAVGDGAAGQRGATAEWDVSEALAADDADGELEPEGVFDGVDPDAAPALGADPALDPALEDLEPDVGPEPLRFEPAIEIVKVSGPGGRNRDEASEPEEVQEQMTFHARTAAAADLEEAPTTLIEAVPDAPRDERDDGVDLDRVPAGSPVLRLIEQSRSERRERADRLANLFPRAETEWNVRELGYDRRRRAEVSRAS